MSRILEKMMANALVIGAVCIAAVMLLAALFYAILPTRGLMGREAVPQRGSLSEYTWGELAAIANQIGSCSDEHAAFEVAARYGLCASDGTIDGAQRKAVELTDGTVVDVRLAGIWHDERTDGGRAGLSFVFASAAGSHAMNHSFENAEGLNADSIGGWAASDMRTWLNSELLYRLPSDLRGEIASVQKKTANALGTSDEAHAPGSVSGSPADWVTGTSDKLWLLSVQEICGDMPAREDVGIDESMAHVYAAEGRQYRAFADANARAFEPCAELVRKQATVESGQPCTWWLRTKTLEFGEGFWLVGTDGAVLAGLGESAQGALESDAANDMALWGPDHERGVVCGFCL